MKTRFYLPKAGKRDDVEAALRIHHEANRSEHQQHCWDWTNTHWYMQGVRRLRVGNAGSDGLPSGSFLDRTQSRRVRIELPANKLQVEMGRLLNIDLSPTVVRPTGLTLDSLRQTAVAQTMYDNFWARFNNSDFRLGMSYMLPSYGMCGIGAFDVGAQPGGVFGATLLLVAPWELRSLPCCVTGVHDVAGVEWCRWVPLDWLRENYGDILKIPKDGDDSFRTVEAPHGSKIHGEFSPATNLSGAVNGAGLGYGSGGSYAGGSDLTNTYGQRSKEKTQPTTKFVEMREHWVYGDDYSCTRWIITLGNKVALDLPYEDEKARQSYGVQGSHLPVAPLHIARYRTVGSFYGQGIISGVRALNKELELLFGDSLQQLRDRSLMTMLMMPGTSEINTRTLKAYMRNGILPYTPDINAPRLEPKYLEPPPIGDMNGRMIGTIATLIDQVSGQGPMFQGETSKRVDSAGGLSILVEQQQIALKPCVESTKAALTGTYRSLIGILTRNLTEDPEQDLLLGRMDESIVGVKYDRSTGKIELSPDALPSAQDLNVTIRQDNPRPKSAIRQDLDLMLKNGIISPIEWQIAAIKEGLDLPMINRAPYNNYVSAWSQVVQMFNDGVTPGEVISSATADNHAIFLKVIKEFMASPTFRLASSQVRFAFEELAEEHESLSGAMPDDMLSMDQFGAVGPPGPQARQLGAMTPPPRPGQSSPVAV